MKVGFGGSGRGTWYGSGQGVGYFKGDGNVKKDKGRPGMVPSINISYPYMLILY